MSIFPILGPCISETRLGHTNGRPVIRTPLSDPYGTVDFSEIHIGDARGYANQILALVERYESEQKAKA